MSHLLFHWLGRFDYPFAEWQNPCMTERRTMPDWVRGRMLVTLAGAVAGCGEHSPHRFGYLRRDKEEMPQPAPALLIPTAPEARQPIERAKFSPDNEAPMLPAAGENPL